MEGFITDFRKNHNAYKAIVIAVVLTSLVVSGGALGFAYLVYQDSMNSLWVAVDGRTYKTVHQNNQYNYPERKFELKQLIKEYHLNRYSGDQFSYQKNLEQAIEYCSPGIQEQVLNDFHEENMEKNITEKGWIYQSYIDSVYLSPPSYKAGYVWGAQTIRMKNRTVRRNMHVQFSIADVSRSERNHLGACLIQVEIFNNQLIKR